MPPGPMYPPGYADPYGYGYADPYGYGYGAPVGYPDPYGYSGVPMMPPMMPMDPYGFDPYAYPHAW